jgi:general secretion pathway protein D
MIKKNYIYWASLIGFSTMFLVHGRLEELLFPVKNDVLKPLSHQEIPSLNKTLVSAPLDVLNTGLPVQKDTIISPELLLSDAGQNDGINLDELMQKNRPGFNIDEREKNFLKPWDYGDQNELVEFNLDNAEISTLISYIEKKFSIAFILDDMIKPLPQGGKSAIGSKITFKTHEPMTKKDAWAVFVTFLDMAGLAPVLGPAQGVYRIVVANNPASPMSVNRADLPIFIGINPTLLPENDTRIRYVYFAQNASLEMIKNVIDATKSSVAPNLIMFPELRALIMTDKSSTIRSILKIIQEIDQANTPEMLSVMRLQHTDAGKVAELYNTLSKAEDQQGAFSRMFGARRQPTTPYFSPNTRVIAEPRTNVLILLGTQESVKKIEKFIAQDIDKQVETMYSPLHVRQLKHIDADRVAKILTEAVTFQQDSDAAKFGGVRDGDKYFKPVSIVPEKFGNQLIINADYNDYVKLDALLNKIDVEEPQVAIKVMVLNIDVTDDKQLGVQIRNRAPGCDGFFNSNINGQTSGLNDSGVIENNSGTGATRLLGDLVNLVTGSAPGSTVLTLGSDTYGVWGLLSMLNNATKASLVATPFIVATNKYTSTVSIGETRRVVTSTVFGAGGTTTPTYGSLSANLEVKITPLISTEGLITLDVYVTLNQFTNASNATSGDRTEKTVQTTVVVNNNEVLALGGLINDKITETQNKVPILGDIPLLGWLFKNKTKSITRNSLLILITPEILPPDNSAVAQQFTQSKVTDSKVLLEDMKQEVNLRDPIHRWFFKDQEHQHDTLLNQFAMLEGKYHIDTAKQEEAHL